MSGEPTAIAFEGFLSEDAIGDGLAIATMGFLVGGDGGRRLELDERRIHLALVDGRGTELAIVDGRKVEL